MKQTLTLKLFIATLIIIITIASTTAATAATVASVSPLHCTEHQNNTVIGWFRIEDITDGKGRPEGCDNSTSLKGVCKDLCLDDDNDGIEDINENKSIGIYRDFYCNGSIIAWKDLPDGTQCSQSSTPFTAPPTKIPKTRFMPEFTVIGAFVLLIGTGVYIHRKRSKNEVRTTD